MDTLELTVSMPSILGGIARADMRRPINWSPAHERNGLLVLNRTPAYCRDVLVEQMFQFYKFRGEKIPPLGNSGPILYKSSRIPLNSLQLVGGICIRNKSIGKSFLRRTEKVIDIFNIMERELGWKLTIGYNVDTSELKKSVDHMYKAANPNITHNQGDMYFRYFKTGPNWVRTPHMVSLFALIVRAFTFIPVREVHNADPKNIKDVVKFIRSGIAKYNMEAGTSRHINRTIDYWIPFLRNFSKVYRKFTAKSAWNIDSYSYGATYEGITKLCDEGCCNAAVQKNFAKYVASKVWA